MKHKYAIIFPIIILVLVTVAAAAGMRHKSRSGISQEPENADVIADSGESSNNMTDTNDEDDPNVPDETADNSGKSYSDSSTAERMITEEELRQINDQSMAETGSDKKPEPTPTPLPKYNEYLEVNPYVAGWLTVDGSKIDGPVVYTPGSQNYFLHRALDGSDSERGTYFIAINWQEKFNHTLIYGHNMKDGTGFGSLLKYADSAYAKKHNIIHFDTLYEDRDYEVLGAFYSQVQEEELETEEDRAAADKMIEERSIAKLEEETAKSEDETVSPQTVSPQVTEAGPEAEPEAEAGTVSEAEPEVKLTVRDLDIGGDWGDADIYREEKDQDDGRFRYYYYTDLEDRSDFDYYVSNVKDRSLYDTGVGAEWGDDLLTLSTCSYQVKNGRFVVVAVHHQNGENR